MCQFGFGFDSITRICSDIFEAIENKGAAEKLLLNRATQLLMATGLSFLQETAIEKVPFPGSRYARTPVPYEVFLFVGFFDFLAINRIAKRKYPLSGCGRYYPLSRDFLRGRLSRPGPYSGA